MHNTLPQSGGQSRPVRQVRRASAASARRLRSLETASRTPFERPSRSKGGRHERGVVRPSSNAAKREQPVRTCVGCGAKSGPDELLRTVALSDPAHESDAVQVAFDLTGKETGRGAWVHARMSCLQRACARGFARSFKAPVAATVEELVQQLNLTATRRLNGLLLAASRARHLVCGRDAVKEVLPVAALIVMATDARSVAKDSALQRAGLEGKIVCWSTKAELGHLLGRAEVGVFAITEHSLAEAMRRGIALSCLGRDSATPSPSLTVASAKELSEVR